LEFLQTFTCIDLQAPYYLNGLVLNPNIFTPRSLRIQQAPLTDFTSFKKTIMGLEFQEDVVPPHCSLVLQLVETFTARSSADFHNYSDSKSYLPDDRLNYFGQLHFSDGQIRSDLRNAFLALNETDYAQVRIMQNNMDNNFKNLLLSEQFGSYESVDYVSSHVKIQVLENQIDSLMLKVFYMILLAGRTFPKSMSMAQLHREFVQPYNSRAAWRITAYVDAENRRLEDKKKLKEKWRKEAQLLVPERMALDVGNSVSGALQKHSQATAEPQQKAISTITSEEAAKVYMVQQCQ